MSDPHELYLAASRLLGVLAAMFLTIDNRPTFALRATAGKRWTMDDGRVIV
jgi:hypothetical protein